jgi:hypothetical protein
VDERRCRRDPDFTSRRCHPTLITLDKAIGALIRARITTLHLEEAPVRDPAKWPKAAAEYLAIASRAAHHLKG